MEDVEADLPPKNRADSGGLAADVEPLTAQGSSSATTCGLPVLLLGTACLHVTPAEMCQPTATTILP